MIKTIFSTIMMFLSFLLLISGSKNIPVDYVYAEKPLLEVNDKRVLGVTPSVLEEINTNDENSRLKIKQELEEKSKKIKSLERFIIDSRGNPQYAKIAGTIIETAEKCNVNYKLMVAIAGYESGFGSKPYKKYNPYGWLNGKQYSSWEEASEDIICDFSHMYTKKGLSEPSEIVKIYVGSNGNKEKWSANVANIMKKVP